MKKVSLIALLATALLVVLVACGPQEEEAAFEIGEDAELVVWADEQRAPVMEELGAQFTETYGVPVTVQQLGFGDIRDNIKVAGPAGEGADIIVGAHDWLGELVASGIVAPIDLGAKADDFTESSIQAFTYEGELYGMPYAVENVAFFYNPELVSDVPAGWDDVLALSREIQSSGSADYGFVRQEGDPYHFFPIQTAFGGYVFGQNPDGTYDANDVGIDNEGSIEAAQWLDTAVEDGVVPAGVDWDTYHALFENGEAAMMITGPWALDRLNASGVPFEIANIPGGGQPFLGVQGFMVSAFSENVPMATAFLTEFVAQTDPMFRIYELGGRPPAYEPALEMVEDEQLAAFGEAGVVGLPMPAIPEMSAVWTAWGDAVTLIMQEQAEGEPAFENAASQIRSLIAGE
jgi:maltose/maltodextrin transport system substrate-binding protein/arabinogalactan oligomer/maltooligosaccharide transport system substrate-binding protein